jgi:hypothetical protein
LNTIGKIVIEGLKIVDPTIKGIDLIQTLAEYIYEKNIKKIDEINAKLLNDEASEYEKGKILSGGIDEEDYLSFIKAAVNDDESKKTQNYITLYRNILTGKVTEGKTRLYKILKELPYSAIELLPKLYIYKHYQVQNKTLEKYIRELINSGKLTYEINLLTQYGLLQDTKEAHNFISDGNITLSSYFDYLIVLFFKEEELLPHIYNIPIWIRSVGILMDLYENNDLMYTQTLLNKRNIKTTINSNILQFDEIFFHHSKDLIIVILNEKTIPQESIDILNKWANSYKILKICLKNNVVDQLNEIEGELIYIEKNKKEDEEKFLSNILTSPFDY